MNKESFIEEMVLRTIIELVGLSIIFNLNRDE
jgi:hypothetical protein